MKKQGYLVIIPADASAPIRKEAFTGKSPPYEALRAAVGGLIACVQLQYDGRTRNGYANDDGFSLGLGHNARASAAYQDAWRKKGIRVSPLVGDVVLILWEKVSP